MKETILLTDGYKLGHHFQYPKGTEMVYSNWTPRSCKYFPEASEGSVVFGIQYLVKEYLIKQFNENFFNLPKEQTGKLTGFEVKNPKDIQSKDLLIFDDLCDGGGTFCGIAAELRKYKPDADISIFVTHMVNRKGIENLAKTFNKVYFTNSYRTWDNLPDNVIQIEIV